MFIKADYEDYFNLINSKEEEMIIFVGKIIDQIQDESILQVLELIKKDEIRHAGIARSLSEFLKDDV